MLVKLSQDALRERLEGLPGWSLNNNKLYKEFKFPNFRAAFAFMTRVALKSEALNHHPEWLNVYDKVQVWLTSHEAFGITENDILIALECEQSASQ